MSKLDLLLHPIRIRIVMALTGRQLTPAQIGGSIDDVPLTSLYRHINALADGGILRVVEEHPVRGTVEKVYALVDGAARVRPDEMPSLDADEHLRYFMVYLASLLHDFSRYLDRRDPAGQPPDNAYTKIVLSLTHEEYHALTEQMRDLALRHVGRDDDATRKRYTFGFISIPEK
jgi:hypothetical protein